MLVSCKDRPGKVYQLSPGADYTKESSWILIGDTSELNNKVQEFIDSKGAPNGLASLNESGIIPSAQLPSYVDDVIEPSHSRVRLIDALEMLSTKREQRPSKKHGNIPL